MEAQGKIICKDCERELAEGENFTNTLEGEPICDGCYEADQEYASTLVQFNAGGKTVFKLHQKYGNLTTLDDFFPVPIVKIYWKSTDAWRGYTAWDLAEGHITVGDGWVTGYPDSTTSRKKTLGDIYQELEDGKVKPPCNVWWMFSHTSNVFSTASSLIICKRDEDIFKEWMKSTYGLTEEDLQDCFE